MTLLVTTLGSMHADGGRKCWTAQPPFHPSMTPEYGNVQEEKIWATGGAVAHTSCTHMHQCPASVPCKREPPMLSCSP